MTKVKPKVRRQMLILFCALLLFGQIFASAAYAETEENMKWHQMLTSYELTVSQLYTIINKNIYYSVGSDGVSQNAIHNEIKALVASQGFTLTEVVRQLNKARTPEEQTTVQNISNKLTRGTIKYSEILEIASVLGLRIQWINK